MSQIQLDVLLPNIYRGRLFFWSDCSTHFYLEDDIFLIGTFNRTYLIVASIFVLSIVYDENESSRRVWGVIVYVCSVLRRLVFRFSESGNCA